jgi:hypothetical protein
VRLEPFEPLEPVFQCHTRTRDYRELAQLSAGELGDDAVSDGLNKECGFARPPCTIRACMGLGAGTTLGPYQILDLLGSRGMSARGHTEPRTRKSEARCRRKFALGWGPSVS